MKYFILGAIPPPLGGVSVYCLRKLEHLDKKGVDSYFFDSRKKRSLVRLIVNSWVSRIRGVEHEIEVNVSNAAAIFILTLSGLAKKCIFYDHNGSRRLLSSKIQSLIFAAFCKRVKQIKVVNKDLIENYVNLIGIDHQCVIVESPFLPPSTTEMALSRRKYPDKIKYLLEGDDRNIILTSAWMPVSTPAEVDLYGLKDSLLIYHNLIENYPDNIFIMMIGVLDDTDFSAEIVGLMESLNRFSNFEFIVGGLSQLPLLQRTAALLRLTKTDGDSVSVHEALHFGVSVIATDVSIRPEGVKLVPVGDLELARELLEKLINKP